MILALLLATQIDCAKYADFKPPKEAITLEQNCDTSICSVEVAMKYANGDGVKRNYDLALAYLCKGREDVAPAEFDGMLEHLANMRAGKTSAPLAFCDHVTSGYGSTFCAGIEYDRETPKLDARIAKVRVPDSLRNAGLTYVRKESTRRGELSRAGTGYQAISLGAELEEKERFAVHLERFTTKRAASASEAELEKADTDLNAAYREAKAMTESDDEVIADWPQLLRDAQRAWITYRDAWTKFYVERWKGAASPDALRREIVTELTRERAKQLGE